MPTQVATPYIVGRMRWVSFGILLLNWLSPVIFHIATVWVHVNLEEAFFSGKMHERDYLLKLLYLFVYLALLLFFGIVMKKGYKPKV